MKIIAGFDSPDSADFAAGAVQRVLSSLSSAAAKELPAPRGGTEQSVFTAYNTASATPQYSAPLFDISADKHSPDAAHSEHIVEVICRKEEYPAVSRILIARGGRNITKL